jgi:hypothetical protein
MHARRMKSSWQIHLPIQPRLIGFASCLKIVSSMSSHCCRQHLRVSSVQRVGGCRRLPAKVRAFRGLPAACIGEQRAGIGEMTELLALRRQITGRVMTDRNVSAQTLDDFDS